MPLVACDGGSRASREHKAQANNTGFPAADRPVATIVSARWSTEEARDRLNEAGKV
ncbi:MAG TPA: SAM-dependent methyltransferase, partial [Allosphingosinicella sp.]|nr:SAM-dependent methyltransferase [Allosphingosinicella sp.]